jgi:hypothetical protein
MREGSEAASGPVYCRTEQPRRLLLLLGQSPKATIWATETIVRIQLVLYTSFTTFDEEQLRLACPQYTYYLGNILIT